MGRLLDQINAQIAAGATDNIRVGNINLNQAGPAWGRVVGRFGGGPLQRVAGGIVGFGVANWAAGGAGRGVSLNSLQPGAPPAAVLPGQGEYSSNTPDYCNLITNVYARAACVAARGMFGGGGGGGGTAVQCPPGYRPNGSGGCTIEGMGSYLPGDIGRPDVVWTPVNGRYGAGVSPFKVQSERLWCPPGYKLGKDDTCYECLGKTQRKWNPGTKPLFTGGDMNALRRAQRLKKKLRTAQKLFPAAKVCRTTKSKRK